MRRRSRPPPSTSRAPRARSDDSRWPPSLASYAAPSDGARSEATGRSWWHNGDRRRMVGPRMKTSLEHLPKNKRALLARAVATIRAEVPEAGMIILFGSHARGDWTHNPKTGYRSDYDLLVVVDSEEIARNVTLWDR